MLVPFNTTALYGMERSVLELFRALRPEVEPHFVLTQTARRENLPILREIQAHRFSHSFLSDQQPWPKLGRPHSLPGLRDLLHALIVGNLDMLRACGDADALYVAGLHYYSYAVLAAALLRLRRRRVLFRVHDLIAAPSAITRLFHLAPLLFTDVAHNAVHSRDWMWKLFPRLKRLRNVVIPQIVSIRSDNADPAVTARFAGRRNLVVVGQLARHKGTDLLLDAFQEIAAGYPDVHLHLLGLANDPEFAAPLHARLSQPDLRERCTYWGYRSDVHTFLKRAHLHIQPSRPSLFHESFGRSAVEAMAVGVPTVCLESGALQEIVLDGVTGVICREETPEALANALRRFLNAPEFRERCAEAARAHYLARYTEGPVRASWLRFLTRPDAAADD